MIAEDGVKLLRFPEEVFNEIAKVSESVVADVANAGDIEKRIFESYANFRKEVAGWTTISDYSYMEARQKALKLAGN
jgi:TRAP-type mannitol/chloroaromatic compound transport system substrate-binding protein